MRIYIGNLNTQTTELDLKEMLSTVGPVISIKVMIDKRTGISRRFGFAEFSTNDLCTFAIARFNGSEFHGNNIVVSEAKETQQGNYYLTGKR